MTQWTLHRYLYAGDDPLNHTDPSGKSYLSNAIAVISIGALLYAGHRFIYRPIADAVIAGDAMNRSRGITDIEYRRLYRK
jgi:hypothetical protein